MILLPVKAVGGVNGGLVKECLGVIAPDSVLVFGIRLSRHGVTDSLEGQIFKMYWRLSPCHRG